MADDLEHIPHACGLMPGHETREAVDAPPARTEREARGVPRLEAEPRLRDLGSTERRRCRVRAANDRARVPQRTAVRAHDAHRPALWHRPHQVLRVTVEVEAVVLPVIGGDQGDRDAMPLSVDGEKPMRRRRRLRREGESYGGYLEHASSIAERS